MHIAYGISIHAPSRERLQAVVNVQSKYGISIHAPSRERRLHVRRLPQCAVFQSTLPRGSDMGTMLMAKSLMDFNPRSLAGATTPCN